MVSDGVGDFLINQSPQNDSIAIMENGILEDRSSENEVLYSTMDLNGTDAWNDVPVSVWVHVL